MAADLMARLYKHIFISYNPCSMRRATRYETVLTQLVGATILVLSGTRDRMNGLLCETSTSTTHHVFKWPAAQGPMTNWCTGVTIALNKKKIRRHMVKQVYVDYDPRLQGRVGGVVVKSKSLAWAVFAIYMPVCDGSVGSKLIADTIIICLRKWLSNLPTRIMPFVMGDFNAYFDERCSNPDFPSAVGPFPK